MRCPKLRKFCDLLNVCVWARYFVEDNVEKFETDGTCSMGEEVRGRWDSGDERLMSRLQHNSAV
jgi:hypothetical protein